jgi:dipeptidyl aminopeptidase/acylaminoacyl peptidase
MDSRTEGWSEIYVIAADGGTPRRVTNSPAVSNTRPSWSRDGRWIYFSSDRSGRSEIWKMPVGGGQAVQVTRSGGVAALESPDGKYIYYVMEPGPSGLFRMPVEGGEEKQVLPAVVTWSGFGVTAKGVYFNADGRTIQFLDTATGKVSTLATLDKPAVSLCVSPDDAYVVWSQLDRNTQDLMLVENFR